jgi:hypothetical protein
MKLNTYKQFINEGFFKKKPNPSEEAWFYKIADQALDILKKKDSQRFKTATVGGIGPGDNKTYIDASIDLGAKKADVELEVYFDKDKKVTDIKESVNESDNWKTVKTKSGDTLKPGKKYKMPRYDGEITFIRFDRDNKTLHLKSNKIGKIRTSINNVKDMELIESVNEANGQTVKEFADLLALLLDEDNGMAIEKSIQELDPKKARTLEKQISTLYTSLFKLV